MNREKSGIQVIGNQCDREIVLSVCRFVKFLKQRYTFPILLKIHLCESPKVVAPISREMCYSCIWVPENTKEIYQYPYILCAVGDYLKERTKHGRDNALASYLFDISRQVLTYQNWLTQNSLKVYAINIKASKLVNQYAETREHP